MKHVQVILFLYVISLSLVASEINLSLKLLEGNDYYKVIKPSSNLEAKLIFPRSISVLSVSYLYDYKNAFIEISSDMPMAYQQKKGEDFDWQNSVMTFYSSSDDQIDLYENYSGKLGYWITENISFAFIGSMEKINHTWGDVVQWDIAAGTVSSINGEVLKYEQEKYTLGMSTKYIKAFNKVSLFLEPQIAYVYHDAIDRHLLRYFYTKQHNEGLELGMTAQINYEVLNHLHLHLSYVFQWFEDSESDMDYYFEATDDWYQTLSSTFTSTLHSINLGITYQF